MLPEFILREERLQRYDILFLTGLLSALIGFVLASYAFPGQVAVLTVVFAALPMVYPLTAKFLEDEKNHMPHHSEIFSYLALFMGQASAFTLLAAVTEGNFQAQMNVIGATGSFLSLDSLFVQILLNNLGVYITIFLASAIIGSAGAFILTWNASVLGAFFSHLLSLRGTEEFVHPILYVPHTSLEMSGFILAGITGSLISAAVYREHFDPGTWQDYGLLTVLGISLVINGAFLETGHLLAFLASIFVSGMIIYKLYTLGDL